MSQNDRWDLRYLGSHRGRWHPGPDWKNRPWSANLTKAGLRGRNARLKADQERRGYVLGIWMRHWTIREGGGSNPGHTVVGAWWAIHCLFSPGVSTSQLDGTGH